MTQAWNETRLEASLTYQIARTHASIRRVMERICKQHAELNVNQWKLLAIIAKFQPARMADLAGWVTFDRAFISRAAQDLEKRGLVERVAQAQDKRLAILQLSDEGTRVYRLVAAELDRVQASALAGYKPREVARFFMMLNSLDERLDAYHAVRASLEAHQAPPAEPAKRAAPRTRRGPPGAAG
ncbi:Multidrug resistance operon repressor [Pigmentiphaga humi]|uniref:Multidrug resistance operon repressor n=1 Tax=Pigmentiphaga humi TaxID=2478468 RepID=A0A3P4B7X5_9BURK|nr:MarR family transcriptional regulator [Pigmentiphaga humi]VCU71265.1 Multidrug resistance operon repressor [Pigmentiphaga humi]